MKHKFYGAVMSAALTCALGGEVMAQTFDTGNCRDACVPVVVKKSKVPSKMTPAQLRYKAFEAVAPFDSAWGSHFQTMLNDKYVATYLRAGDIDPNYTLREDYKNAQGDTASLQASGSRYINALYGDGLNGVTYYPPKNGDTYPAGYFVTSYRKLNDTLRLYQAQTYEIADKDYKLVQETKLLNRVDQNEQVQSSLSSFTNYEPDGRVVTDMTVIGPGGTTYADNAKGVQPVQGGNYQKTPSAFEEFCNYGQKLVGKAFKDVFQKPLNHIKAVIQ